MRQDAAKRPRALYNKRTGTPAYPRTRQSNAASHRGAAPEVPALMKSPSSALQLPFRRGSAEFCVANEADQEAVYQTLLHVFHGPDRDSFLGALSDPSYRPEQRLLVKVDGRVASHVHLTERQVR